MKDDKMVTLNNKILQYLETNADDKSNTAEDLFVNPHNMKIFTFQTLGMPQSVTKSLDNGLNILIMPLMHRIGVEDNLDTRVSELRMLLLR